MSYVIMLEDDQDDRSLTKEILIELSIDVPLKFFSSSTDFFRHLGNAGKPKMILVDYNSTPDTGIEVLKQLKQDPAFHDIPVIMLSDSDQSYYKKQAYQHGANSFITKPSSIEETRKKIGVFFTYWMEVAE